MKHSGKITTLDAFIEEEHGALGTASRAVFESGYKNFEIGHLIKQARLGMGMTQEELALKSGTNKAYISKIENDLKEARLSTLQRIVEQGLGGELKLTIDW